MTSSGFCQPTYPRVVVVGRDSIVAITFNQMDSINNTFIWHEQLRTINDSITKTLDSCRRAFYLFHQSDSILHAELQLKTSAIADRDTLISAQKQDIADKRKLIRKLRLHRGILGTIAVAEAFIIGWLILR